MNEPIVTVVWRSDSGIILVFESYRRYKTPRRTTSAGELNAHREILQILLFISKTVQDRPIMEH